jgi:hypothetical protein
MCALDQQGAVWAMTEKRSKPAFSLFPMQQIGVSPFFFGGFGESFGLSCGSR